MGNYVFQKGSLKILFSVLLMIFVSYVVWVAIWAKQGSDLQVVQVGLDTCSECGMMISDIRTSVSILDQDSFNHTVTRHFDDIACFQKYAASKTRWEGIAHDYETGKPLPLGEVDFVKSDNETPMGSGLIALRKKHLRPDGS